MSGIIAKANTLDRLNSRCVVVNTRADWCPSGCICPVDGGVVVMLVRSKNAIIGDAI
jgi:hypothetical protein